MKHIIDLSQPDKDANYLLGFATRLCMKLNWNLKKIIHEMEAGDMDHLIKTFEKYFSRWVQLINKPQ